LHGLVILIERRGSQPDYAPISSHLGWPNLEHFALHAQLIAWADRARPTQFFQAHSENTVSRLEFTLHQETHGYGGCMPSTCRKPFKNRLAGCLLVKVVRLRIELRCESENLPFVDLQPIGPVNLACCEILEILFGHPAIPSPRVWNCTEMR